MTGGETLYLVMSIAGFVALALALAYQSHQQSHATAEFAVSKAPATPQGRTQHA